MTVSLSNRVTGRRSTRQTVTLDGEETIWLCANSQPYSDPVPMEITPEDDILVSMYFRRKTGVSFRLRYLRRSQLAEYAPHREFHETDALGYTFKSQLAPTLASDPYPNQFAAGICEVAVLTDDDVRLIAMFGDSITHMSYFSDSLLTELYRRFPGKCSVINGGISR